MALRGERTEVRVHLQDRRDYCGAAVVQMIAAALTGSMRNQDDTFLPGSGDWSMSPQGVAKSLNRFVPDGGYRAYAEPDATRAAAILAASLARARPAVILNAAPAKDMSHWIAVSGLITRDAPAGPRTLAFVETRNPARFDGACASPPHAPDDCCGTRVTTGISVFTWFGLLDLCGRADLPPPETTHRSGYVLVASPGDAIFPDFAATPEPLAHPDPPEDEIPNLAVAALGPLATTRWEPWAGAVAACEFDAPVLLSGGCSGTSRQWLVADRALGRQPALVATVRQDGVLLDASLLPAGARADAVRRNVRARSYRDLVLLDGAPPSATTGHASLLPTLASGVVWRPSPASNTPALAFRAIHKDGEWSYLRLDGRWFDRAPWDEKLTGSS